MSRLYALWNKCLTRRPWLTNMVTYGSSYAAAEISQQLFYKYFTEEKPDIDWLATGRVIVGGLLFPSTYYFWYKFLDDMYPRRGPREIFLKVAADQCLMMPLELATFFIAVSYLEDIDIRKELKEKYWTSFLLNQIIWIPAQILNFAYIEPKYRVTYVAAVSFLWINLLCFLKRGKITN